jgi:hypothetical protein
MNWTSYPSLPLSSEPSTVDGFALTVAKFCTTADIARFTAAAPVNPAEVADPDEWVRGIVEEETFWLDGKQQPERSAATRRKLAQLRQDWGVA